MRIASNKLQDILAFYKTELSSVYDPGEIDALIREVCMHFLGFSAGDITLKKNENLNQSDVLKLYDCCKELKKNIPLQYILGETVFYNLKFITNKSVLIPRPETEELVELILNGYKNLSETTLDIIDIGTGSGCIPIALKKNLPDANVSAIDVSQEALHVAQKNALLNNTTILFNQCDILTENVDYALETYDLIVSNPPYIAKKEASQMHERVKNNEPEIALFVEDEDAIIFFKRIINLCNKHLNTGGILYFELNPIFSNEVKQYAEQSNLFSAVDLIKDLSGNTRFLKAIKYD